MSGEIFAEVATDHMRKAFPHGHADFIPLLVQIADLHSRKNKDYAASDLGLSALGNFERVARIFSIYEEAGAGLKLSDPRVIALVYSFKQLDQVLFSIAIGREGAIEGNETRLQDDAVYKLITILLNRAKRQEATNG